MVWRTVCHKGCGWWQIQRYARLAWVLDMALKWMALLKAVFGQNFFLNHALGWIKESRRIVDKLQKESIEISKRGTEVSHVAVQVPCAENAPTMSGDAFESFL